MTGIEIVVFVIGVVIPTVFKIVDFVIDRFFPNTKADNITDVMAPFIETIDNAKDSNIEVEVEGAIETAEGIIG
ncbi:MAG: hypothetical protein NWP47_01515 [Rickettsiaceae bacterium]|nr:hypothetical protein [Rickettsiaceae bacterium]